MVRQSIKLKLNTRCIVILVLLCTSFLYYNMFRGKQMSLVDWDITYLLLVFLKNLYPDSDTAKDIISEKKLILLAWNKFTETYPYKEETAKLCPQCIYTEDMAYINISHAVVFNGLHHNDKPPDVIRNPSQIWVWFYLESPQFQTDLMQKRNVLYQNLFNWTMTYRHDSDIWMPYGRLFPFKKPQLESIRLEDKWAYLASEEDRNSGVYQNSFMPVPTIEELKSKKLVAWIVSHCGTNSKRSQVAQELGKYLQVDIYGGCGKLKCPTNRAKLNKGKDCRFDLATKYKFYLAFENSICEDYLTEKLFRTFLTQMVPLVYASTAMDHSIVPKDAYVNVADFDSINSLAEHLHYLDKNHTAYLEYFKWRNEFWVWNIRFVSEFCALCDKLWMTNLANVVKIYPDVFSWFENGSNYGIPVEKACVLSQKIKIT